MNISSQQRTRIQYEVCAIATVLFLVVLLLTLAFNSVPYNAYGFIKSRTTGSIDRTVVYYAGLYLLSPDQYFITYPSKVQTIVLNDMSSWSAATSEDAGTPLELHVTFQFRLIPEELDQLYDKVVLNYEEYIANVATNVLKNRATQFSADNYLQNRRIVQVDFEETVMDILRQEAHCELISLQLSRVEFPEEYYKRKTAAGIQLLKNDNQQYQLQSKVTRSETAKLKAEIKHDADEVTGRANAEVQLIKKVAVHRAKVETQKPRIEGLLAIKQSLGLTNEEMPMLDKLVTLQNSEKQVIFDATQLNLQLPLQ